MTTFYLLSGEFGASLQSTQNGKRLTKEKNCVLSYSQILYNGSINCLNCHYKHLSGANEIGRKVCKFHGHTMRRFLSDLANLKHRFIFNFSSTEKKINTWDCNLSTEVENFLKLPVCLSSLVFFLNPQ